MIAILIFIFIVGVTIFGLILFVRDKYDSEDAGAFFTGLGIFGLITYIIIYGMVYTDFIAAVSNYDTIEYKIDNHRNKKQQTMEEIKAYIQEYSNYEKDRIKDMNEAQLQGFLFKYPELRAVEPIKIGMERLSQLNNELFAVEGEKIELYRSLVRMNNNTLNPFLTDRVEAQQ